MVQVVEVDHVDAEPAQAAVAGGSHGGGVGVHAPVVEPAGTTPPHPELRAEQHLVAASADRPTDLLLVAVHLGGVEQGDAGVDGGVHKSYWIAVGVCRGSGIGLRDGTHRSAKHRSARLTVIRGIRHPLS